MKSIKMPVIPHNKSIIIFYGRVPELDCFTAVRNDDEKSVKSILYFALTKPIKSQLIS